MNALSFMTGCVVLGAVVYVAGRVLHVMYGPDSATGRSRLTVTRVEVRRIEAAAATSETAVAQPEVVDAVLEEENP